MTFGMGGGGARQSAFPLRLHDVFYGALILDERDDPHLISELGALERIHFADSLFARGPTTPTELSPIVTLLFFRWRRKYRRSSRRHPASIYKGAGIAPPTGTGGRPWSGRRSGRAPRLPVFVACGVGAAPLPSPTCNA